ncbi:hypothetical protein TNCV_3005431 [Trichonephila clavipes]|nr:hypothetical protein TNCV_3005431 [Trichonephila clavipes]
MASLKKCCITNALKGTEDDTMWKNADAGIHAEVSSANGSDESFSKHCSEAAFGDGPRGFEPWSSDVDDTELAPVLTTLPHQREGVSTLDRFNVHRGPTRRVFSGTGLELTYYEIATAAR